jgi:gamma-glutamyltranspeptidase/glutathione hydrolase
MDRPTFSRRVFHRRIATNAAMFWPCLLDHRHASAAPAREPSRGAVATVHPIASQAARSAIERGGNAIDAAVAAALMLGVVDSHNSGLGGGCLALVRRADGAFLAFDGREAAPARAHRDMFLRDGKAVGSWSQTGALAVAVPGALAAYERLLKSAGRLQLPDLLRPAADRAEQGFPIDRILARNLRESADSIRRFPATRALLFGTEDQIPAAGDTLRQPDLARTYRAIADQGTDWFYRGEYARQLESWMAANGGLVTADDLARYEPVNREPVCSTYRGYTIVGFPPPSSGGLHVAQILNILERFDLAALYRDDPATMIHVVVEAMKRAFADRAHWLGDSDFTSVPRGLLNPGYAAKLATQIDLRQASTVQQHDLPPDWQTDVFRKHTTHVATADAEGNWVALTATVNTSFGSKVVIPGTGLVLNNEMDDFSIQPGVPNAFGLVGSDQNAIAPGKRPLSSMSPTIVLREGRPVLTLGAAGGPKIITQVVIGLIRFIDLQQPLDEALAAPRWHHQWRPDRVLVEAELPVAVADALRDRGHVVEASTAAGVSQAIELRGDGTFKAVHDPRVPGASLMW